MSQAMQQGRINKTLDTRMQFSEGVMTRREWLLLRIGSGATASTAEVPSVKFNRVKYNRMEGGAQQEYDQKLAKTKTEYRIWQDSTFWAVTKTEYDFFLANGGKLKSEIENSALN